MAAALPNISLGLRANWKQFWLLVLVNAFVGGMAGMERTILPQLAESHFHVTAQTGMLSFIIAFGLVKALANYYAGTLAHRYGRRRLLIAGWWMGLPVPFMLLYAPSWSWVLGANVLLGMNQGLAWSSTVVMKMDLAGNKQRGLAMGLNEFAGYLAVAVVAWFTGWLAIQYGLVPYPFYTGVVLALAGLIMSIFWVKDTGGHVHTEAADSTLPRLSNLFWQTSWKHPTLGSVSQAGLVNNLNDGMVWGILPVWLGIKGYNLAQIGVIAGIYPAVWGLGQLVSGALADKFCKKKLLVGGMLLQALALFGLPWAQSLTQFSALAALLGWGTALVYPTFLATVAESTHPHDRARSIGVFRLWRDLGYAIGALLTGLVADALGIPAAIFLVAMLTGLSAIIIAVRVP